MTSRRRVVTAALLVLAGCFGGDGLVLPSDLHVPLGLKVAPVSLGTIRLEWKADPAATIVSYRLERRENLQGAFTVLNAAIPQNLPGPIVYFDSDLPPDTHFGYRVTAVDRLGKVSSPSTVGGARTPSLPGIDVSTVFLVANPLLADPDGYTVVVEGPETRRASIGVVATRRFSPLSPGVYTVRLEGVAAACTVQQGSTRTVTVSDQTIQTISTAPFPVTCRDASRGEINLEVSVEGEPRAQTEFTVDVSGIASDNTLPESQRIYSRLQKYGPSGGKTLLENLRPGSYQISMPTVPSLCVREGAATREVGVIALSQDAVRFALRCAGSQVDPNDPRRPFVYINEWSAASTNPGATVQLDLALDLSQEAGSELGAIQAELRYDPSVVRFDRVDAGDTRFSVFGSATAGSILWSAFTTTSGATGRVGIARMTFTVLGQAGTRAITRSTGISATTRDFAQIDTLIRIREDTLAIAAGTPNQTPVAEANGPYSGAVGTGIQFSSTGSSDPDGTLASFAWQFGDGGTGTGASPSHAYAAAGTYAARVTVTDNRGATASDQAQVTVSGGGGNQSPIARINGPYTGAVGAGVSFSAAGSTDPDGTIAAYAWSFGDGTTGNGATVSKTYTAAGTYTVSLTVTDNGGATATAQTTATVTGGTGGTPFTWSYTFGVPTAGVIPMVISLDLSTNIPETAVAEALASWAVPSLVWDPKVLQFFAFNFGSNASGSVDPTNALQGRLQFGGTIPPPGATGIINIATVRFRAVGAPGSSTTMTTTLGALLGTAPTGGYNYRTQTRIVEGTYTVPGGNPQNGVVTGTVKNSQGAPLAGVLVTLTPGGAVTTNAQGVYTRSVPVGSGTVALSGVPGGCTVPAGKPYAIGAAGQSVTVDFTVTCQGIPATGTVTGTLTRSSGGALAGATVSAAGVSTTSEAQGQYSLTVPVGTGTVTVSGVPGGCTVPAGKPYAISAAGQSATVDFTVTCQAAPPGNALAGAWTVSGATATLEIRLNVVTGTVGSIEGTFNPGSSRLQYTGFVPAAAPALPSAFAGNPPQTAVTWGGVAPGGMSGNVGVIKLTFTILPGAPATANGTFTGLDVQDANINSILASFAGRITVAPLSIP